MTDTHLDSYLELVSDTQRRQLLHRLRSEPTGETTVEELVDQLHDDDGAAIADGSSDRGRITIQLVHNHLPMLDDLGVIRYDPERGTVRYRSDDRIETVLNSLPKEVARPPSEP